MKYVFIVNPVAGNDNKAKIFSRIKSTFRLIDDEMIVEPTHAQGEAKLIAQKYAAQYGSDCVIVSCGGDGTVHEIANGLANTDTPLLLLPLGTGNDFAKKVYGTKKINVENVIKAFGFYSGKIKYDVKPIDLIDYNGEKCINVMSYGLDTKVETIGRQIALSITDSTFTSSWRKGSNSCEAIQLDILHDSKHFPGFEEFDDTPNKNVTISGCTFSNLHSGIGTRSAVVSKYFDNVVIENNKFENIQEKAISCFNYKNSKIINNTFTNVNSGICFEYLPNNFFGAYSQRMYIANDKSIGKINSKSSTVISGNVMNIKQMAKSSYGIYAYGAKVDASTAKANGIVAGDYTISDLSIDNNTINVEEKSPKSYGIYITGVNKSEISSNTLTDYSSAENGINGINICASQKNDIKNNNISGTFNNGISIFNKPFPGSKNLLITSNSISGVKSYGIRVAESSFATIKSDNNISAGLSPLCLYSQNYSQNVPTPSVKSKGYSLRNKPLIRFSSLNGSAGYKVSRSAYNGTFKEIATVYGENLNFEDKSSTAFSKNYYRVTPIYNVGGTVVTGKNYIDIAF